MANFRAPNQDSQRGIDAMARAEQEAMGYATFTGKNPEELREQEEASASPKFDNYKTMTSAERADNRQHNQTVLQRIFKSKKLKKRTSVAAILLTLAGGGSAMTLFLTPSLAVIHMKEVFTKSFNEQLHSVDERSAILMRSKLKDLTSGSCGAIKIKCKFKTISAKQVEKFKAAGIDMEMDTDQGFGKNRGRITKISFTDPDTKEVLSITKAEELQKALLNAKNTPFRAAMLKGYNPLFSSVSDKLAMGVMSRLKISKGSNITGETDEERQKRVNDIVSGVEDGSGKVITVTTDDEGKEHYVDSDGVEYSKDEYEAGRAQAERSINYEKTGGWKNVLSTATKGASIVGYMDSACTVYNSLRHMSALAKVIQNDQAARFAMAMIFNTADEAKAGFATEGKMNFVGNNIMTESTPISVVDESQLTMPGSASNPATTTSTELGNAFDGPGWKMANGEAPDLSLRASQYMIGGGPVKLFGNVLEGIAKVVTLGNTDPQTISEACKYVQNPVVRFAGLGIGIVAGIGTFGLSTALGIGGSLAFAMMLPYIEAHGADMLAGNVFKNLSGIDTGDAAAVGGVALFGSIAKARSLKPLTAKEGLKYAMANQETYASYANTQRYMARATPLDITNPYSFMGSLAGTLTPILQRSKSSATAAMMNIMSLIPTSFASLTSSAGAAAKTLDDEYYSKCPDIAYKQLGLGANVFCQVSYGLSEEDLALDSDAVVDYMVANNEIDTTSDYGDAKDNGRDWNYVKYLDECPNRTTGWGENEVENEGNGWNCIDPAKEAQNRYYRIYSLDKTVDESLDGGDDGMSSPAIEVFYITRGPAYA